MPFRIEVAAVDPELAEAESQVVGSVQHLAVSVEQRETQDIHVPRRMKIPEPVRLPVAAERDAAVFEVGAGEEPCSGTRSRSRPSRVILARSE